LRPLKLLWQPGGKWRIPYQRGMGLSSTQRQGWAETKSAWKSHIVSPGSTLHLYKLSP